MNNFRKLLLAFSLPFLANAQKAEDIAAIKGQCGCFDVDFRYAETFAPDKDYQFHDRYHAKAIEYVLPIEDSKQKIVLQHLLIVRDSVIVKHWREDWQFEEPMLFSFDKDRSWKFSELDKNQRKGTWTQKVFQTDDSPRYEGYAQWFHGNGEPFWESAVDAPLPRREYSKRKDYNVMHRGNRIYITDYGYLHEQDNKKFIRDDAGNDELLAEEKGYNAYRRVDMQNCQVAQKWWEEHQAFWADVRAAWDEVFAKRAGFEFKQFVRTKMFGQYLDELEKAHKSSEENRKALHDLMSKFVVFESAS
ncbi:hypothetical protein LAG90_07140 [Marinilongibacter aquaticus]|uniref:DUF6607 family protein n=1 Tax=Marinilongibacter aquaticus TaxID=2975157 RepID=UPI0021BD5C69|nr:DUF6607 family protein [Marinilongibacter aquaticus]UBM60418.1 hypothetical protein LAG90_07140 [Marinilongibacter aquaticus]